LMTKRAASVWAAQAHGILPSFLVAVMMMGPTPQSMPWDERWHNP
jgi:hypothetical protein